MESHLSKDKRIYGELAGRVARGLRTFWSDERGQSTTEYILILSVVVMIAMKFKSVFSTKLMGIVDKLGTNIDDATNQQ